MPWSYPATTRRQARFRRAWFGMMCFAVTAPAFAEKLVTVRATVDSAYAERRSANSPPLKETYVFAKGQYFAGGTYDSSLYNMSFERMAKTLAFDLQKQNYEPTKELKTADLVIVVHWGVTMPNDRGAALMSLDPDALRQAAEGVFEARQAEADDTTGDLSAIGVAAAAEAEYRFTAKSMAFMYNGDDVRSASNAEMLGLKAAIEEEDDNLFDSSRAQTLRAMIDEERYFIIMIAYDGKKMREGRKQRVWTSRMSIRSAGVNFGIGLDRMSQAGGKFHGTQQKSVAMEYQKERKGSVQVGEFKVLNQEP